MKLSATQILALGAVGVVGVAVWAGARNAAEVAQAVNPVNPDNIVNRGFNAVLERTGVIDPGGSFGSWLYDRFNPSYDPNKPVRGPLQ